MCGLTCGFPTPPPQPLGHQRVFRSRPPRPPPAQPRERPRRPRVLPPRPPPGERAAREPPPPSRVFPSPPLSRPSPPPRPPRRITSRVLLPHGIQHLPPLLSDLPWAFQLDLRLRTLPSRLPLVVFIDGFRFFIGYFIVYFFFHVFYFQFRLVSCFHKTI